VTSVDEKLLSTPGYLRYPDMSVFEPEVDKPDQRLCQAAGTVEYSMISVCCTCVTILFKISWFG
jgi:hypothetical protein